ncbi:hypothetical protein IWQ56_002662, partial [Coemansia nantahalensis]
LKLRIDMLEAENRVLRLRSEQDKAHLTASQMLAKDLGAASPVRGHPTPHSPDSSAQQLADMRDALERERRAAAARVEQLEAQVAELRAAAGAAGQRVDTAGDAPGLVELQSELQHTANMHAKELAEALSLHSELSSRLEQSAAKAAGLQTELDAKADEICTLNASLEQQSAELSRAQQRCLDLTEEHERRRQEDQPAPETQAAALGHEPADAEDSSSLVAQCCQHLLQLAATMQGACGDAPEEAPCDAADAAALIDWTQRLAASLAERHAQAVARAAALAEDVRAKDASLSDYERKFAEAVAGDQDGPLDPCQKAVMQAHIEELEAANVRIAEGRDELEERYNELVNYVHGLESVCEGLETDVDLLRNANRRLADDLSTASLQNSAVSLDIGAPDSQLSGDHAPLDAGTQPRADTELAQRPSESERRKDGDIKRLQDEIGSLENLLEDKIFAESELNDRIAALTGEVDRLQRELVRARGAGGAGTAASADALRAAVADEHTYCDICDSRAHGIADCPELATRPESLFKQDVPVDLSRPYCDNCESFGGHWTDECPHGDDVF